MQSPTNTTLNAAFAARAGMFARLTRRSGGSTFQDVTLAESITVRRELAGDVPEAVSLVGGAVTTRVTINADLAMPGAPHPMKSADRAAWLGADIELAAGYSAAEVPVFWGSARELSVDDAAKSLTIEALDNSDRMRAPVSLPMYGSHSHPIAPQTLYRFPTNLSAVIVAALHASGIRVTPAPRNASACVISVPFAFGALADIGWTVPNGRGPQRGVSWLTPGRFVDMPAEQTGDNYWNVSAYPDRDTSWEPGAIAQVEFWYKHTPGTAANPVVLGMGALAGIALYVDTSSRAYLRSSGNGGATWTNIDFNTGRTLSAGWHHIAYELNYAGRAKLWLDGNLFTDVAIGSTSGVLGPIKVQGIEPGKVQALHVYFGIYTAFSPPTVSVVNFTAAASVDRALLEVETLPRIDGRIAWELCKEIASAELGMVGFSELGQFYFKNRDTLNGSTTPVATWGTDLLDNIAGSVSVESIRTRVTSSVQLSRLTLSGRGATAVPSYLAQDVLTIPTGISSHMLYPAKPFAAESATVSFITLMGGAWESDIGIALSTSASGATRYTGSAVSATIHPVGPNAWQLIVRNSSTQVLYTAWPAEWSSPTESNPPFGLAAGAPAIWVNGRVLADETATPEVLVNVSNTAAITKWGDRALALDATDWRQDVASVTALANRLLADLLEPRFELHDISVPPDLRWQIGDPVLITDWQGRVPNMTARITSIEVKLSQTGENGMVGTYGLRALPGVG
ncbi:MULTISPECIES: hypothetical protein [unclassified Cryobacterium]|uniref:hypothetical protein n=1 Tax=unclassified Cryobacterium TaxID=2649013 RepID=UPI002AB41A4B|nr:MULTISPECIES: hypothetical protein [unclassified Cryobacterium]MDY7528448.1 hypothetical protein [Cryobacterium sp. 10C2]MDY7555807.1 hypothetical protein [Cryobacterium sp. 10C3]MEB0289168.1 hypothetical protein [Cryobacterium sp. 10C2]